jgi:hypothetical protein
LGNIEVTVGKEEQEQCGGGGDLRRETKEDCLRNQVIITVVNMQEIKILRLVREMFSISFRLRSFPPPLLKSRLVQ